MIVKPLLNKLEAAEADVVHLKRLINSIREAFGYIPMFRSVPSYRPTDSATKPAPPSVKEKTGSGRPTDPLITDAEEPALRKRWIEAGKPKLAAFGRELGVTYAAIRRCAERHRWGKAATAAERKAAKKLAKPPAIAPKPDEKKAATALKRIKGDGGGFDDTNPLDGGKGSERVW